MIKLYSILLLFFLVSCTTTRHHVIAQPWDAGKVWHTKYNNDTTYIQVAWFTSDNSHILEVLETYKIKGRVKTIATGDSLLINTNWEGKPTLISTKTNKKTYLIIDFNTQLSF